ncbi:MAG: aconitase/3-isopropylmalate dehydratase large subunit family protein [Bacteroidales bacterium]
MTIIEKILAQHAGRKSVKPGDIVDIVIDARAARDFGGANVVKNLRDHALSLDNPEKTMFTFDCNPTGSDQKYAVNQHICRLYAREQGVRVYDIDAGIGTHILIDRGHVYPGATAISTDSHANILGAIGAFGQGMGDMDIASAWNRGKVWFKVPESVQLNLTGKFPPDIAAKDIVLNLLKIFGANTLLGYSLEIYGDDVSSLSLDDRITISSMATEMGAIILLFPPDQKIIDYCRERTKNDFKPVYADPDAAYADSFSIDVSDFRQMVSRPGKPHDTTDIGEIVGVKIDSAFIGSCTNGRIEDMRVAASVLKGRHVAPGVVLKIVPSTDAVWNQCLEEGLIAIFKEAGALVSNAGCAGCAAGQVGQNGPGEITVSTGNRNFPGKQGKGSVYLASPAVVAASAVAGVLTSSVDTPVVTEFIQADTRAKTAEAGVKKDKSDFKEIAEGKCRVIMEDNIDTDMIFHNRYLAITDIKEMGQYTFDNLGGHEDFASKAEPGDIIVTGKNFGSGSSRQQAVDCFISLGVSAIIAESFGAIYERNAINAAFPVMTYNDISALGLNDGDRIRVNYRSGEIVNMENGNSIQANPFSEVQIDICRRGGLLG